MLAQNWSSALRTRRVPNSARWLVLFLFLLPWLRSPISGQEGTVLLDLMLAEMPSNRVTVAMLPLENATGDPALGYWRFAASAVLGPYLGEAKGLRRLPQSSLKYGLAQLGKKTGETLDAAEAGKLGELIEARRVLWGNYRREGGKWRLTVQILKVSEGTVSKPLTASSPDWFELRDDLGKQILKELGVAPTKSERRKMSRRWTRSAPALEWLSRAQAAFEEHRPAAEWENYARRAIEADPRCAEAHAALALCEVTQGKTDAALTTARRAINFRPDLAAGYAALGHSLMMAQRMSEAEEPLEKAALLDPDNPARFGRLAEYYMIAKDLAGAAENFKHALQSGPFQSSLHANLGRALLLQGKREAGLAEMKEAQRLDFEPDLNTEEYLAWGYARLNDAPAAIAHYEKALTLARQVGLDPKRVKVLEQEMADLKAAMTPAYVTAHPPKDFTEQSLTEALREKLTREEEAAVIRPLATTPEINLRARELTRGATNDLHKAKLLFEALTGHLDVGEGALRTAPEVFAAWNGPASAFRCQEYALLYVMMARAAGLRAYFVDVSQACDGEQVWHACAVVFDGEKALLVDPSYRWFGVPHKKFTVLNDLETTGDYMCQLRELRLRRIAVKL